MAAGTAAKAAAGGAAKTAAGGILSGAAGKIALAVQNFRQGAPIIHPLGAVDQVHIVAQRRDELGFRGLKVVFKGKFHVFRQFQTAQRRRADFLCFHYSAHSL